MVRPFFSAPAFDYNRAQSLGRCVQSCLDQTFVDFEVGVVDDRWIDGTTETMRSNPGPSLASLRLAGLAEEGLARAVPLRRQ